MDFVIVNLKNTRSYSTRESAITFYFNNTVGSEFGLRPDIQFPRLHSILDVVSEPASKHSYGFTNEYTFRSRVVRDWRVATIHLVYANTERQQAETIIVIVLSAILGLGAGALFQAIINFLSRSTTTKNDKYSDHTTSPAQPLIPPRHIIKILRK